MNLYKAFIQKLMMQQIFNIREQQALAISTFEEYAKSSAPSMDGNLQQAHFDVEDTSDSSFSQSQPTAVEEIQTLMTVSNQLKSFVLFYYFC